jgi:chemotaxis protein CheX
MNVKFLNPFLDAAASVLKQEIQVETKKGDITLHKSALTTDDISVIINLVGQVQGVVIYELSKETGLQFVSRLMEQKISELDALAQSGIAELGNVISGRATVELSKSGYDAIISPPTMVIGKGTQISTIDFPRLVVPIGTELGDVIVHLAIRESPPDQRGTNFVPLIKEAVVRPSISTDEGKGQENA